MSNRRRVDKLAYPDLEGYRPLSMTTQHRVGFSEVDPMQIVWFGRYAVYFEEASAELRDACGLSHAAFFDAMISPPIVSYEVQYLAPCRLDEIVKVTATLHASEAARLNISYQVHGPDGTLRVVARTAQVFMDMRINSVCFVAPDIWTNCLARWKKGDFACLQR
jgi:acyl-CoA thioester hydrolase